MHGESRQDMEQTETINSPRANTFALRMHDYLYRFLTRRLYISANVVVVHKWQHASSARRAADYRVVPDSRQLASSRPRDSDARISRDDRRVQRYCLLRRLRQRQHFIDVRVVFCDCSIGIRALVEERERLVS